MAGNTSDWTREDVDRLYPNMPQVAASVWENIQKARPVKPSHTPGPWTLETVPTSCGICHKIGPFPWRDGKQNHACVYVDYPGSGPIEAELMANARLIAAAPDLLAALKLFMEQYHTPGDTDREARPEIKAALAAIKKATPPTP